MTDRETGEALRPPKRSSQELVEELTEHFAVDLTYIDGDYSQYMTQYPLPPDSLGIATLGKPDVAFEKYAELESSGAEGRTTYNVFIGCGSDTVLTITAKDGELYGGFGEAGAAGDNELDPDDAHALLTKLATHMWLHERGLSSAELATETVINAVVESAKKLARTPVDMDHPDGDLCDVYPLDSDTGVWTGFKAELWWFAENEPLYRLALMDGGTEIIDLCVEDANNKLVVSNYSGDTFEGDEALRRIRIVFSVLTEMVTSDQITPRTN